MCPWPHAGGSWATTCWQNFAAPVAVEEIQAHAGLDIGGPSGTCNSYRKALRRLWPCFCRSGSV
uniref:DUF436 family protein n=1 Tax=Alistipes shahii TaxID=328814 RepID=UPI003FEF2CC1